MKGWDVPIFRIRREDEAEDRVEYYETDNPSPDAAAMAFAMERKLTIPFMATLNRWDPSTKTWEEPSRRILHLRPQPDDLPPARRVTRPS